MQPASRPDVFPVAEEIREQTLTAYRHMLAARLIDEKMGALYRAGKVPGGGTYLGRGQEALSVSCSIHLRKGDVYSPLIRDGAGRLAFGESFVEAFQTCLGSAEGPMRGREGNVHRGRPRDGYLAMISHLGAMVSVVNGVLMAKRLQGIKGCVGVTSLGEGATSTGACHEALNQASVERLPLVLVIADNQFAYSTPREKQFHCRSLVDRAVGYGMDGHEVDGTDLSSCLRVLGTAVSNARAGRGPQLVVASLLRLCGHGEHDDAAYIPTDLRNSKLGRDCLEVARQRLLTDKWVDESVMESWKASIQEQIESAVIQVQREAPPNPAQETWSALASRHLSEGYHANNA